MDPPSPFSMQHLLRTWLLNKEHLLEALCKALNIDMHVHHEVVGVDKSKIKAEIKMLKKKRDEAIAGKNPEELRKVRKRIKKS